jgi:hypothetical protein
LLARAEHPRRGVLKTCRDDRRLDIKEETMRKTMITMATVALASGLFAGTALAGGEGKGGGSQINQIYCGQVANDPVAVAPKLLADALGGTDASNNARNNAPDCHIG